MIWIIIKMALLRDHFNYQLIRTKIFNEWFNFRADIFVEIFSKIILLYSRWNEIDREREREKKRDRERGRGKERGIC